MWDKEITPNLSIIHSASNPARNGPQITTQGPTFSLLLLLPFVFLTTKFPNCT